VGTVPALFMTFNVLYPDPDRDLARLGREAALLLRSADWVLRRKEKVTLLDEITVRRQMSVDFQLPSARKPLGVLDDEPVSYAPLFFLQKGLDEPFNPNLPLKEPHKLFANFDFRNEYGTALSLPPRAWNGLVTSHMLRAVLAEASRRHPPAPVDPTGVEAILHLVSTEEQLTAERFLEALRREESFDGERWTRDQAELLRLDREDRQLHRMLNLSASASVAMVPLIGRGARHGILKLSYDDQVATVRPPGARWLRPFFAAVGWAGYELWVVAPSMGSETFHFEFQTPAGLELYDAGLVEIDGPQADRNPSREPMLDRVSGHASRLHLYAQNSSGQVNAFAWVRLRVRRQEFVGGAAIAAWLVALTLWGAWLLSKHRDLSPVAVPTLLLLAPSFIAAYTVRPGAHRLTTRMLKNARWIVGLSGLLPFLAAAMFAFAPRDVNTERITDYSFRTWWLWLAVTATVLALTLLGSVAFPIAQRNRDEIRDLLQRVLLYDFGRRDREESHPRPWLERWRGRP
jgi:hypothetical protein